MSHKKLYRKLLDCLQQEKVDYEILRATVADFEGRVYSPRGIDIFINPSRENLKRLSRVTRRLAGQVRLSLKPKEVSRVKNRVGGGRRQSDPFWSLPTKEEFLAFRKLSVEEKLNWLEEVNRVCQIPSQKGR